VERSVFVAVPADQTTLKYYARARAAE